MSDFRADQRASRRFGGGGGGSDDTGSDFGDDQEASRRVGGSGDPSADPDPDPAPDDDFGADQDASRRVGGSGDPSAAPEPAPAPVETRVNTVTSGVSDTVSAGIDAGQDVASDVSGGVDRVEETLPGATGTAFAAGAGLAAVPEPTPVTEVSGTAIAGGAALVGGGVLASRALRDSEIDVGERVRNELEVGESRRDVTEIEPGANRISELEPGTTSPVPTEVGVGSTVAGSEVDVPTDSGTGLDDTFGATGVQIGREEAVDDDTTITRDDLVNDLPDVDQPAPSIRERQRREELTAPEREFPTGESAVVGRETASEIADGVQEPTFDQPTTAFGTGVGFGQATDPFLGGGEFDDEPGVSGIDRVYGGPRGVRPETLTEPSTEPITPEDVGTGGGTEPITDTGTDQPTDTATATTNVEAQLLAAETAVGTQPALEEAAGFAEPELTAFETQVAEPTVTEVPTNPGDPTRDRRDPSLPTPDEDDEEQPFEVGLRADELDSGILSGDEALRNFLGR